MEMRLKLRQIGSLEKSKLVYDKEVFPNSGEIKIKENTSRTISPVKDYKDESKIVDDMDILERITLMKELKKNESYHLKGKFSNYRNAPYASSSEQIIISPEFPSPNSSNFIPKSIVSSSTVSIVGKEGSNFGDDTMNNSLYQYFTGDLKKNVRLKDSSDLLKEGEISSRRKQNTRDEVISELPDEELGVTTPQESPRRLFTQPTTSRHKRKTKNAELTLELKNVESSSYDTEEDVKDRKKTEEKKGADLFDFDDTNKYNSPEKPICKTTQDLIIKKPPILNKASSPFKVAKQMDQSKELDKTFQLHQIIFNNSINKDMSKINLNQTSNSPRNSVILHDEPDVNDTDQYCMDNMFSQIIALSPELKINKPLELEKKKRSVNFFFKQDDKSQPNPSKPALVKPEEVKIHYKNSESNLSEPLKVESVDSSMIIKVLNKDEIINPSVAELPSYTEEILNFPTNMTNNDTNCKSSSQTGMEHKPTLHNGPKFAKYVLPEEEMFIRFNKRGWICVYCHNFNFEARKECNRCKAAKNAKKKAIDPITGLYIDKAIHISTLPNNQSMGMQHTLNSSPNSNPYINNSSNQSVNNNLLSSQQIGNNPSSFNLMPTCNSNQIHNNNIYQPNSYSNSQYNQTYYPGNNNISNNYQQPPNFNYPNNFSKSVYYNNGINQSQQNLHSFSQHNPQFSTLSYPTQYQNSIQQQNLPVSMQNQSSEVKIFGNGQFYYKPGYYKNPTSY